MFQGLVDIIGFRVQCKLLISPDKFELEANMSVVDIGGGVLKLRKSAHNKEEGPYLYVSVETGDVR